VRTARLRDDSRPSGERPLETATEFHGRIEAAAAEVQSPQSLARRRARPQGRRSGTLLRRSLLAADLAGLSIAFVASMLVSSLGPSDRLEAALFVLTLPGWVVVARLHGLYDCDEKRLDYSFVDDLVGVFHLVTIGAWLFVAA
jgi:hypothetical protein